MSGAALLSDALVRPVVAALRAAGDGTRIRAMRPVRGGFESHSLRIDTGRARYFCKWSERPVPGRYSAEAAALALLAESGTVRVPVILAVADTDGERPGFLLQEWLSPPAGALLARPAGGDLGARLAALHRADTLRGAPLRGYARDLGEGAAWEPDWVACYRERCLRPAIERAERGTGMPPERRSGLERLLGRLEGLLGPVPRRPSLLHGDLHRNNVLRNAAGELVLIDPHPYVGDREAELAYTEWVGGLPPTFYAAYEEAWPSSPGRKERRDLYLLWYMLRALGEGDARRGLDVDALLRWYVGARA